MDEVTRLALELAWDDGYRAGLREANLSRPTANPYRRN